METQTTHKLFIGDWEIGHIAERNGTIYNPSNLGGYIYSVTLVNSDFEGRAALVKSLQNQCKISRSFWEFPTFYFEKLEVIFNAISELCHAVPVPTMELEPVAETEDPSVTFAAIGEDFEDKFDDVGVALLLYIKRLVNEELIMRHDLKQEDEADYFANGSQE